MSANRCRWWVWPCGVALAKTLLIVPLLTVPLLIMPLLIVPPSLASEDAPWANAIRQRDGWRNAAAPGPLDWPAPHDPATTVPGVDEQGFVWTLWSGPANPCRPDRCTWDRTIGTASDDKLSAAAQVGGGDFIVVGNTRRTRTGSHDAWVARLRADGMPVWRRDFAGRANDQLRDVVAAPDGGVFVAGHTRSRGAGESDLWLARLGADGVTVFQRTYGGPANDRIRAAVASDDGGVILAGFTESEGAGGRDLWLTRFAGDGTLLWSRTLGTQRHEEAYDVTGLPDGGIAVTGYVWTDGAGGHDMIVARFSSDGELMWRRTLDRTPLDVGTALAAMSDGGLIVAGTISLEGVRDTDLWVVRLGAEGRTIWQRTYGGSRVEEPWDIAASASGDVVVAAQTYSQGAGGGDIWLMRLSPDGDMVWERLFGGALWDHPSALLETADGSLLLGGHTASKGAGFEDGWLLRLTAEGRL